MRRRSVMQDTIYMTVIQFVLECLALGFQSWMARQVGASSVGILALAGSFFNLAAMVAGEMECSAPAVLYQKSWDTKTEVRGIFCDMELSFVCC